jgi:hypothetical protein
LLPKNIFEILVKIFCNPIAIFEKLCYNNAEANPCPENGRTTAGQIRQIVSRKGERRKL